MHCHGSIGCIFYLADQFSASYPFFPFQLVSSSPPPLAHFPLFFGFSGSQKVEEH
jgi:hypothetical protein